VNTDDHNVLEYGSPIAYFVAADVRVNGYKLHRGAADFMGLLDQVRRGVYASGFGPGFDVRPVRPEPAKVETRPTTTVADVARQLGISQQMARRKLREGSIEGYQLINRSWVVTDSRFTKDTAA
jgi:hypothetical protein